MTISKSFSVVLIALLPVAALAPACSEKLGTKGQLITCTTDPDSGVITRCEPGDGGGGSDSCQDIDEDGNGIPREADDTDCDTDSDGDSDSDSDGIPDVEDCDEQPGEDECEDEGEADLPYDVRPKLGDTTRPIVDAFAEENSGPSPAILKITFDGGGSWRRAELEAGTAFVVTQADCDHSGNRDTGRDRVFITWRNANGSTSTDHLDIRYCD